MEIPLILQAIVVASVALVVALRSDLVRGRNIVDSAWLSLAERIDRRHELIVGLSALIRQYASHDRSLFDEVTEGCTRSSALDSAVDLAIAENALSEALSDLLALAEAYPELVATPEFLRLREEVLIIGDDLCLAGRHYNDAVHEQSDRLRWLPGILASAHDLERSPEFEFIGSDECGRLAFSRLKN